MCTTCGKGKLTLELGCARERFNRHADRECEVVIRGVEPGGDRLNTGPTGPVFGGTAPRQAGE